MMNDLNPIEDFNNSNDSNKTKRKKKVLAGGLLITVGIILSISFIF